MPLPMGKARGDGGAAAQEALGLRTQAAKGLVPVRLLALGVLGELRGKVGLNGTGTTNESAVLLHLTEHVDGIVD